ncbi:hypothetical protein IPN41_04435 [Candidatus Falkowbacteria bacterium]|jgi:uncharacterized membrane protein|nr:MAG: hypothetical protein IPN41_04435 [Candidatus Falkowbacteria bacterium]
MTIFFLTLAGFLFSGYLSLVKLLSNTCALNEPCPYFLGYPACWYGFGMFTVLFILAIISQWKESTKLIYWFQIVVSLIGIIFAGYFTVPEIIRLFNGTSAYSLGLPTCAYGLIFYILIFILATRRLQQLSKKV